MNASFVPPRERTLQAVVVLAAHVLLILHSALDSQRKMIELLPRLLQSRAHMIHRTTEQLLQPWKRALLVVSILPYRSLMVQDKVGSNMDKKAGIFEDISQFPQAATRMKVRGGTRTVEVLQEATPFLDICRRSFCIVWLASVLLQGGPGGTLMADRGQDCECQV